MAKMITVDQQRCLACKACEVQCALAHSGSASLSEALDSGQALQPRVHVEAAGQFGLPIQCRHCQDAPCVMVCPTEAIARASAEAPVLVDSERCIGCGLCMLVCPFGVIDLSRQGKGVVKCDLCAARTGAGQEPACVEACPTGALKYEEVQAFTADRRHKAAAACGAGFQPAAQGTSDGHR